MSTDPASGGWCAGDAEAVSRPDDRPAHYTRLSKRSFRSSFSHRRTPYCPGSWKPWLLCLKLPIGFQIFNGIDLRTRDRRQLHKPVYPICALGIVLFPQMRLAHPLTVTHTGTTRWGSTRDTAFTGVQLEFACKGGAKNQRTFAASRGADGPSDGPLCQAVTHFVPRAPNRVSNSRIYIYI